MAMRQKKAAVKYFLRPQSSLLVPTKKRLEEKEDFVKETSTKSPPHSHVDEEDEKNHRITSRIMILFEVKDGEIQQLKKKIDELNFNFNAKDLEVQALETQVQSLILEKITRDKDLKDLQKSLESKNEELLNCVSEWEMRASLLQAKVEEKDEELFTMEITHSSDLESQNEEFLKCVSEWDNYASEWVTHASRLQTKVDEATKRFVGTESGLSKVVLSILSTMISNGMNVGAGSLTRESERLITAVKKSNGFIKGYYSDADHETLKEELRQAKRRRIVVSQIDEDRFYEEVDADSEDTADAAVDAMEAAVAEVVKTAMEAAMMEVAMEAAVHGEELSCDGEQFSESQAFES
jgi:hypothetical protein